MPQPAIVKKPIAHSVVPKTHLTLGGKEWDIVVTINVLIGIEDMFGVNMLLKPQEFMASINWKRARGYLWLCLREQGADYSLEDVGRLITKDNLEQVFTALGEAYKNAMPQAEEVEGEEPDPLKAVGT